MPEVSIIIPNYNHAEFLQQRLDSVFNQTYPDFEVILLDDASSDGSVEILKKYQEHPKVSHLILNDTNSGSPFKQWQKGIGLAKGAYIWIAESDDYCELDFLETCLEAFTEDIGVAYTQSIDVDADGRKLLHRLTYTEMFEPNLWKDNFTLTGLDFISKYLIVKNVIPNASAVVFKKELVRANCFNKQLLEMKMCGDWFFWIQLVIGSNISFINQDLNFFRHHNLVSRNHQDIFKKRQRLKEEFVIRVYLSKVHAIVNKISTNKLLNKWFVLHSKKDLFSSDFYALYDTLLDKIMLAFQFVGFKLKH